jgi:hypothetical protein
VRKQRSRTKRWLLWCVIEDTPQEDEEFMSEEELRPTIFNNLIDGIRINNLRLQPLPERKKIRVVPQITLDKTRDSA